MQVFHPYCKECIMRIELKAHGPVRLADGQTLRVVDGAGTTVVCKEGTVWVTEENQARDVVLEAGACVRLKRAGLTLIQALSPATLSLA
jgi:hypothetical protein